MNWEAIGAVGEIVGALATVLTLAYLALQIRQNTTSVKAASAGSFRSAQTDFNALISQNLETADLYYRGLEDPDSLSDLEKKAFGNLLGIFVLHLQHAEELEAAGTLSSEAAFARDGQLDWVVAQPGFQVHMKNWVSTFPPRFRTRAEEATRRYEARIEAGKH